MHNQKGRKKIKWYCEKYYVKNSEKWYKMKSSRNKLLKSSQEEIVLE